MPEGKRQLVYLASNVEGLELERYEIERQLARMNMTNVGFPCRDDADGYDWNLARKQIELAEFFILLTGDTYGPMAPTGISFLHREFVHARTLNKPIIAFVKSTSVNGTSPEQSRLKGFHQLVMQQAQYKLWHFRDELLAHVRNAVSGMEGRLGEGWVRAANKSELPASAASVVPVTSHIADQPVVANTLSVRERLEKSRQTVHLQISAKVYQGGNLSREELILPARIDQLYRALTGPLSSSISEDRLRSHLEAAISDTVKKQLLKRRPQAHAVDDIRISKGQFRTILDTWQELGIASSNGEGARSYWVALAEPATARSG
jgi:hypothetical protein